MVKNLPGCGVRRSVGTLGIAGGGHFILKIEIFPLAPDTRQKFSPKNRQFGSNKVSLADLAHLMSCRRNAAREQKDRLELKTFFGSVFL